MKSISELKKTLREIDVAKYPELSNYTKDDIWRDIGPGGLYLVSLLSRDLELQPGSLVLDLGCGSAESSIYLAENYNANVVVAVDLLEDPTENAEKIKRRRHSGSIIPLRLNVSEPLPFAEGYFDAILCANSLNFFGTDITIVERIARHLKRGGVFCSGGECLNEEFTSAQIENPPHLYNFARGVWEDDFLKSHSPAWWAEHISHSNELELVSCTELKDGPRYYEERALLSKPEGYFDLTAEEARELEIRQIEYGRENKPYMTVYQLKARRRCI